MIFRATGRTFSCATTERESPIGDRTRSLRHQHCPRASGPLMLKRSRKRSGRPLQRLVSKWRREMLAWRSARPAFISKFNCRVRSAPASIFWQIGGSA